MLAAVLDLPKKTVSLVKISMTMVNANKNVPPCKFTIQLTIYGNPIQMENTLTAQHVLSTAQSIYLRIMELVLERVHQIKCQGMGNVFNVTDLARRLVQVMASSTLETLTSTKAAPLLRDL